MSAFDLADKVCIVTGAGRGIGRAMAEALARHGGFVVLVGRTQATLDAAADAIGDRVMAQVADVAREADVLALRDAVLARAGRIDVLVNNAGVNPIFRGIERISLEEWQQIIDVNLTGVFNTVEIAIPSMKERGRGGAIVLTSSTAGINGIGGPTRGGLGYTAAKHGVVGLMRSYANTLAPYSHARRPRPGHPGTAPARPGPLRQRGQPAVGRRLAHRDARRYAPGRAGRDSPSPGTHPRPARRAASDLCSPSRARPARPGRRPSPAG